jgi:hypothetical protein
LLKEATHVKLDHHFGRSKPNPVPLLGECVGLVHQQRYRMVETMAKTSLSLPMKWPTMRLARRFIEGDTHQLAGLSNQEDHSHGRK